MATMKSTPSAAYKPPVTVSPEEGTSNPPATFWEQYGVWIVAIVLAYFVYRSMRST